MANCLYLFPDTNLFIQCRELRELGWSEWDSFDEVHLIVCRPVQNEIDDQRKRGNSRVPKRARKTYSSLFRPIATGEKDYLVIQESGPCVKLFLEFPSLPDRDLADTLNYDKSDDEIVGCLSRYTKENPEADARLLTDDTGPMMTARGLGLMIEAIDPAWKLPTENDDAGREIMRLNTELARLKKQEPEFTIRCVVAEDRDIERLEFVHNIYVPMDVEDIPKYIGMLEERHPVETEFNQPRINPNHSGLGWRLGQEYDFRPASDEAITNYKDVEYPQWLDDCNEFFVDLHGILQRSVRQPAFRFVVANKGSRPGNNSWIVIRARGNFLICPPQSDDTPEGQGDPTLPRPPTPPRGRWRASPNSFGRLFDLGRTSLPTDPLHGLVRPFPTIDPSLFVKQHRDPNGFYYKPLRITEPADTFSLECEQWRHGTDDEGFDGYIYLEEGETTASGVLECEIHAENLSGPVIQKIPVHIKVQCLSARDYADRLVNPDWTSLFDITS